MSFLTRSVLSSSSLVASASGFFLRGDDGSLSPDTVLGLTDALELLRGGHAPGKVGDDDEKEKESKGDGDDADDDAIVVPEVVCRRAVHGCVFAVAALPVKVRIGR